MDSYVGGEPEYAVTCCGPHYLGSQRYVSK
jgi:hypothetical protein